MRGAVILHIFIAILALALPTVTPADARSDYDVAKVIEAARRPKPNLYLVTAHRGIWGGAVPENTTLAIDQALDANIETVEIDVRMSASGDLWLLHDFVLDRLTSGHGLLSATSNRELYVSTFLKDRDGAETNVQLNTIDQVLYQLAYNLTVVDGRQRGYVLVIDLKSPPGYDPNKASVSAYRALEEAWRRVKFTEAATNVAISKAIIFKIKAKELPAPITLEHDLGLDDDSTFHIEPVLHPNDVANGDRVLEAYREKPYTIGFEVVLENYTQTVARGWHDWLRKAGRTVPAFPGWDEYPEGVPQSSGICCLYRDTNPRVPANADYSGALEYQMQIGGNWYTSDVSMFLDSYFRSIGKRDLSQIR